MKTVREELDKKFTTLQLITRLGDTKLLDEAVVIAICLAKTTLQQCK